MKGVGASALSHVHMKREREREKLFASGVTSERKLAVVVVVLCLPCSPCTEHLEAGEENLTRWKQVQARGMKPFGERSEMVWRKFCYPIMCLIDFSANEINESGEKRE